VIRAALLIAVAGSGALAHGQAVLRMLVSADGGTHWSSSVSALPGSHVEVLAAASYTGSNSAVLGFGSAIFQPIVSSWDVTGSGTSIDRLSPISQGSDSAGGTISPQANSAGVGSPNPYLTPTPGVNGARAVPGAAYVPGTYGRVLPVGTVFLDGPNAITGFIHTNPPSDQLGRTYAPGAHLRIAQASVPDWFNSVTNNSGGSGVNCRQTSAIGRFVDAADF
jgi:hypothetical protein